ncbi:META domain-containing protein [Altererythrobacter indicus]|uniref:META domain-containing protein n=2 Tax=Altericroceibacterium indicum TaxID=374177 RepID=A0A845A9N3_9SPHN|nr:META domain-containing protein [Altericroceibacterium indicum]
MTNKTTKILLGLAPLLLAGCATNSQLTTGDSIRELAGTSWELLTPHTISGNTPKLEKGQYTITFGDNGQLFAKLDCNRGSAQWSQNVTSGGAGSLTISPVAMTKVMCPTGSLDTLLAKQLQDVRSYSISDGLLSLSLQPYGDTIIWRPIRK